MNFDSTIEAKQNEAYATNIITQGNEAYATTAALWGPTSLCETYSTMTLMLINSLAVVWVKNYARIVIYVWAKQYNNITELTNCAQSI